METVSRKVTLIEDSLQDTEDEGENVLDAEF
jgi:hypothetical protein